MKLEFGSLTEQRPTASHTVRPWVADGLPEAFGDWQGDVVALDLHRSSGRKRPFSTRSIIDLWTR